MSALLRKFGDWLSVPVHGSVLGLFRLVYGLFMIYEMTDYIKIGLIRNMYVLPRVNLKYDGLHWLKPMPEMEMHLMLLVMLACAVLIAAGVWFKWACRIFGFFYLYLFLLDKGIYNNHLYLFILMAFMLGVTDADNYFSLKRVKDSTPWIPRWQQFIIGAHFVLVYFFASTIKMKYDWWVNQQPIRVIVESAPADWWMTPFLRSEFGIMVMMYAGFAIDFFAPLLLWYKPIRNWAILPFAFFHFTNSHVFGDIGIFPYVMLTGLVIFFEASELPFFNKLDAAARSKVAELAKPVITTGLHRFLIGYFAFQLLFPIRGYFLPNDEDWTSVGMRFSWRVKPDNRKIEEFRFIAVNNPTRDTSEVNYKSSINDMQVLSMVYDPRSVLDLVRLVQSDAQNAGYPDVSVYARIRFSHNGRTPQYFIDPNQDLTKVTYSPFRKLDWVMPLQLKNN